MKFSIKDFSSKCDQIHSFLLIWSHLLEKSLMGNFIFCAVIVINSIDDGKTMIHLNAMNEYSKKANANNVTLENKLVLKMVCLNN